MTRRLHFLAALVASCCALLAFASLGSAQSLFYGADGAGNNPSNLFILNPSNGGVVRTVGPIGFGVTGLAIDPTTGTLYGATGRNTGPGTGPNPGSLITINRTTGAGILVGDPRPNTDVVADLTFTPDGQLYGWLEPSGTTADDLVSINKATGAATIVGVLWPEHLWLRPGLQFGGRPVLRRRGRERGAANRESHHGCNHRGGHPEWGRRPPAGDLGARVRPFGDALLEVVPE